MENKKDIGREIIEALNWRFATKVFDPTKKVSDEDMHTILESARLSPSSAGLEMWKFLVILDPEIRKELREKAGNQPKITDASHLVVITYRTDVAENITRERLERTAKIQNQKIEELGGLKQLAEGSIGARLTSGDLVAWTKAQAYIPLGIMVETASLLRIDNGPMEGFIPERVDEILNLKEKNLASVTMIAFGYRGDDPMAKLPKVRREFDEVIEFI